MISSCSFEYKLWEIDEETAELVSAENERISVYSSEVREYSCASKQDIAEIKKKLNRCLRRKN